MRNLWKSFVSLVFDFEHQYRGRTIRELILLSIIIVLSVLVLVNMQNKNKETSSSLSLTGAARFRFVSLPTFKDVDQNHWAAKQIAMVSALGIISGYPDETFRPRAPITRAQMAAMLVKAKGKDTPLPNHDKIFEDVPTSYWAAASIYQAVADQILSGYSNGTFKPNQPITKAEGIVMITRFATLEPQPYENYFSDVTPNYWAAPYISAAVRAGILKPAPEPKPLNPKQPLTRAEAVALLYRTKTIQDQANAFLQKTFKAEPQKKPLSKKEAEKMLKKIDLSKLKKQTPQKPAE